MKYTQIVTKLDKSQFNEVKELYADFFRSINFNNEYSSKLINVFAHKKTKDIFSFQLYSKYYFAIHNDEIIGFIHGKIEDGIGLISHAYVKEEYRKKIVFGSLFKSIIKWFKECGVSTLEIEVSKQNRIFNNIESYNWQKVRDFDDASVFNMKI